ncbi:adenylate kinase isoenzyme 5 isoform X2 [Acinonyx jubatus]|uniref:Adenylate kinase isoenzyme 5 isoform X2 n=1 Tax=Acinonyx jubatus TaxID=32536 RepID=A0ABM3PWE6_ACIJB|nr:adenylate kinase isoenzyme 5 isoform X2 [Acinonyx jubatus]
MGLCKSKLPHKGRALRSRRRGIITDLISNTMLSCQESWAFLTDGFPWKLKQAKELERIVGRAPDLIMFDCSMDVMVCRVWHRGQKEHRVRDCESALRQGLETYDTLCEPVLTSYQQNNLLRNAGTPCLPLTPSPPGEQGRGHAMAPHPGPPWACFPSVYTGDFRFSHWAVTSTGRGLPAMTFGSKQSGCLQHCNIKYILERICKT